MWRRLRTLCLSQCHMDGKKVGMLAEGLKRNGSLAKLVLSRNPLGPRGVATICAALLHGMSERRALQDTIEGKARRGPPPPCMSLGL